MPEYKVIANDVAARLVQTVRLRTAFPFAVHGDAGVDADAIHPRLHVAAPLEGVEALPKIDKRFLHEVVHRRPLVSIHHADGRDGAFQAFHHSRKFPLFVSFVHHD